MELAVTVAALAIAFVLLWPAVSGRGAVQGVLPAGSQQLVVPSTFQYRLQVWNAFFVPALLDDVWLGTGTVIPSVVPTPLVNFVDNEYLREGFRAGVVGLSLLALMMATIAVVGWRSRASPDPTRHSLGGALVAMVLFFAVIDAGMDDLTQRLVGELRERQGGEGLTRWRRDGWRRRRRTPVVDHEGRKRWRRSPACFQLARFSARRRVRRRACNAPLVNSDAQVAIADRNLSQYSPSMSSPSAICR